MSSVQTGQLISLLINNVLMVIIVMIVTLAAWLRWQWLQTEVRRTRAERRRCRWAYVSFVLTAVTLLGMLVSLGILTLRTLVTSNALVMGAMGIFLLSVVMLLAALGLWLVDLCSDVLPVTRRVRRGNAWQMPSIALLPAAIAAGGQPAVAAEQPRRLSRRAQRRQRR